MSQKDNVLDNIKDADFVNSEDDDININDEQDEGEFEGESSSSEEVNSQEERQTRRLLL